MDEESPQPVTSLDEATRAEKLRRDQALDARPEESPPPNPSADLNALAPSDDSQGSGATSVPGNVSLPEGSRPMADEDLPGGSPDEKASPPASDDSSGPDSGSQDPVAVQREKLRADTAQAAMAKLAGESSAADMDIDGQINKQTSRLNHWMLETEIDALIDSDISTCGLSLIVTLPTRIVFCGVLALELRHALMGSKSMIPYFPTLTWESFMPPGTEISIPLPTFFLYVAVVAYLLTVIGVTLVALAIIAIVYGAVLGGAAYGFEFLSDLFAS